MAKQRTERPSRQMKPIFLIFCEGETEETYLDYLKQSYRSPIKIISKVEGADISQRLIDARRKELKISQHDKVIVFLMYDMDIPSVNERRQPCLTRRKLTFGITGMRQLVGQGLWRTSQIRPQEFSI